MSLYGNQEPAKQQQEAPPNYYGAPQQQQQQPPNYYGAPPPQQQQQQPNYYGAPAAAGQSNEPHLYHGATPQQQQPNYYGPPPPAQQQQPAVNQPGQPVQEQQQPVPVHVAPRTTTTDADVPGLKEISPGVRRTNTGPASALTATFAVCVAAAVVVTCYGCAKLAPGAQDGAYFEMAEGAVEILLGIILLGYVVFMVKKPVLRNYETEFDDNARKVSVTSSNILLPCCTTETVEINYSEIQRVAFENVKLPAGQRSSGSGIAFSLTLSSGARVAFRGRIVECCCGDGLAPEDGDTTVARFIAIINNTGYSVSSESRSS